jgi:methylenetetrahydrofolate dehydrogenase (NAD+)
MMAAAQVPKTCKVILADTIAKGLLSEVKETLERVHAVDSVKPRLIAFLANDDPAAIKYAEWSKKTSEEKWGSSTMSKVRVEIPSLTQAQWLRL